MSEPRVYGVRAPLDKVARRLVKHGIDPARIVAVLVPRTTRRGNGQYLTRAWGVPVEGGWITAVVNRRGGVVVRGLHTTLAIPVDPVTDQPLDGDEGTHK